MSQSSSFSLDRGLLLIRAALGVVFVMHGWQKLALYGLAGTTGFLSELGIPLPGLNAAALIGAELVGGALLLAGAGTRVVSLILAFTMAVAALVVHGSGGFFLPTGYEYAATLGLISMAMAFTGAGRYSVDAAMTARGVRATV